MSRGAKKLSEGDFDSRISLPGRNDEFGSLAESFNAMADSISDNIKLLSGEVETAKKTIKRSDNLKVKDDLTGLYNRMYMLERVKEEEIKSFSIRGLSALIIINIDDFKNINNIYGTKSGDIILLEVSKIIDRQLRRDRYSLAA